VKPFSFPKAFESTKYPSIVVPRLITWSSGDAGLVIAEMSASAIVVHLDTGSVWSISLEGNPVDDPTKDAWFVNSNTSRFLACVACVYGDPDLEVQLSDLEAIDPDERLHNASFWGIILEEMSYRL
jgi:hypothetical protein